MKSLVFAALAAFVCSGAAAQGNSTVDLDGGVTITLSDDWKVDHFTNPAMRMGSMRDMVVGASETRLERRGTGILVSYMHFKSDRPVKEMDADDIAAMDETTKAAAAPYLRQSVETEVSPRSELIGGLGVSLATLTAREGQTFNIRSGYPGGCVTTGSLRRGAAAWAVSVASESCTSETHLEAVEALFGARST